MSAPRGRVCSKKAVRRSVVDANRQGSMRVSVARNSVRYKLPPVKDSSELEISRIARNPVTTHRLPSLKESPELEISPQSSKSLESHRSPSLFEVTRTAKNSSNWHIISQNSLGKTKSVLGAFGVQKRMGELVRSANPVRTDTVPYPRGYPLSGWIHQFKLLENSPKLQYFIWYVVGLRKSRNQCS